MEEKRILFFVPPLWVSSASLSSSHPEPDLWDHTDAGPGLRGGLSAGSAGPEDQAAPEPPGGTGFRRGGDQVQQTCAQTAWQRSEVSGELSCEQHRTKRIETSQTLSLSKYRFWKKKTQTLLRKLRRNTSILKMILALIAATCINFRLTIVTQLDIYCEMCTCFSFGKDGSSRGRHYLLDSTQKSEGRTSRWEDFPSNDMNKHRLYCCTS